MMYNMSDVLVAELRHLIRVLGTNGGLIGPSIYDTAQVLRLAPPSAGPAPALDWLLKQQASDGGWGDTAAPRTRTVPTLAALLALHLHPRHPGVAPALQAGLCFLREHGQLWAGSLPEDLPVGIELLLPYLLQEADGNGLELDHAPYAALVALGQRRRQMIARRRPKAGTTAVHSWEAWGVDPDPCLLDGSGGVGHNPAATAAWLRAASQRPDLATERAAARHYLEAASAATAESIPGVVPTVWPIPWFEQSNALYALLTAGLLNHPALEDVVRPQLAALAHAMRPDGLGMSDWFIADADDTAQGLAVLQAAGYPVTFDPMRHFDAGTHFCAYPGELQAAPSTTAHGVQMLALFNREQGQPLTYVLESQLADGRWPGDKWHTSWLFTTSQVVLALRDARTTCAFPKVCTALLNEQHPDGGWGMHGSNAEETAFAALTIRALLGEPYATALEPALQRAETWLRRSYKPFMPEQVKLWIGKETYRPLRLSRMIELVATVPNSEHTRLP